jgi:hypothetical protein
MDPCVFCGSTAGDATIEDVIPKWARRAFAAGGMVTVKASDWPDSPWRPVGRPDNVRLGAPGRCDPPKDARLWGSRPTLTLSESWWPSVSV